jgi:hypothetical protein
MFQKSEKTPINTSKNTQLIERDRTNTAKKISKPLILNTLLDFALDDFRCPVELKEFDGAWGQGKNELPPI